MRIKTQFSKQFFEQTCYMKFNRRLAVNFGDEVYKLTEATLQLCVNFIRFLQTTQNTGL